MANRCAPYLIPLFGQETAKLVALHDAGVAELVAGARATARRRASVFSGQAVNLPATCWTWRALVAASPRLGGRRPKLSRSLANAPVSLPGAYGQVARQVGRTGSMQASAPLTPG